MAESLKTDNFDQPQSLMLKTLELAKGRDMLELYAETHISFYWLRKFMNNEFKNPSVNRVQFLYEHLTGTKLI